MVSLLGFWIYFLWLEFETKVACVVISWVISFLLFLLECNLEPNGTNSAPPGSITKDDKDLSLSLSLSLSLQASQAQ